MNGCSCVTVIDDLYFRQNAEEVEVLLKERGETNDAKAAESISRFR